MLKIVSSQPHRPNDLERQELLERLFARLSTLRRTIPAGILSRRLPAASTTWCAMSSTCSATSCATNPVARKISEGTGYTQRERGRGRVPPPGFGRECTVPAIEASRTTDGASLDQHGCQV